MASVVNASYTGLSSPHLKCSTRLSVDIAHLIPKLKLQQLLPQVKINDKVSNKVDINID